MTKILNWNKYTDKARQVVSEGIVCLENNGALPLKGETAVFGRMQLHYYKSGTGSGGLVNVKRVWGILDGLRELGAPINEELAEIYAKWDDENPVKRSSGWSGEPLSQAEMPLTDDIVTAAAKRSDTALCIIARTGGEEQENEARPGSYFLSETEEDMLAKVRSAFDKMVVVLNVGNIMDMSFVKKYHPDAVLYVWQGGMTGGLGTADVLLGVSPSGKLPDTIPVSIEDHPAYDNYGDPLKAYYKEDIFVGYRYFETFAKDKVLYPFGYGLSYTTFAVSAEVTLKDGGSEGFSVKASVKNTGTVSGKETVQIYVSAPSGKLGKAARVLCGFEKTPLLVAGEDCILAIDVDPYFYSSYDDCGKTEYPFSYVLETGEYRIFAGTDVRSAECIGTFRIDSTVCIEKLSQALAPYESFTRMTESNGVITYEEAPLQKIPEEVRRQENMPVVPAYTGDKGFKFGDIGTKCTMDEFIAQLSDEDLCVVARGEGCGSPKVTAGTTSAFGGLTDRLSKHFEVPVGCTADGPSGLRFDCGTQAFSLPIGTLISSTFNKQLITELFSFMGRELIFNKVECILGPGMNIHRYPLNGRNFEYFSEDPFLTGMMAAAELDGLQSEGVTGTIKHFCGNNQETGRRTVDSVVSERALREIYLKGFEIAVKKGRAQTVMTTYGMVNGLYTAGNYDLCTTILRSEWGFEGFVMTDWWSDINRRGSKPRMGYEKAQMASAQNDVYMCVSDAENCEDTLKDGLSDGSITRAELHRNTRNVFGFLKNSNAYRRQAGTADTVIIEGREEIDGDSTDDLRYFTVSGGKGGIDVSWIDTSMGSTQIFVIDTDTFGRYNITITASVDAGELAQTAVSVFSMGTHIGTFTFNGTNGKDVSFTAQTFFFSRYITMKLFFAQGGINLTSMTFERLPDDFR